MLTIKPGILIARSTAIRGGVQYLRTLLDHQEDGLKQTEKWETIQIIQDTEELAAARDARKAINNRLAGVAAHTSFGLICPEADRETLEETIRECYEIRDIFNRRAKSTVLRVSILPVRLTSDDSEAVRSIRQETARLVSELERAAKAGDAESIADVSKRAVAMGKILEPASPVAPAVEAAVKEARKVASAVRRRVIKKGEALPIVLAEQNFQAVSDARALLDDMADAGESVESAASVARAVLDDTPGDVFTAEETSRANEIGELVFQAGELRPEDAAGFAAIVDAAAERSDKRIRDTLAPPSPVAYGIAEAAAVAEPGTASMGNVLGWQTPATQTLVGADTAESRAAIFGLPRLPALVAGELPEVVAETAPEEKTQETAPETAPPASYRPEFLCQGVWSGNGQRFATIPETRQSAAARCLRWRGPDGGPRAEDYRATPTSDPVNYRRVDGIDSPLPREKAGPPKAKRAADPLSSLSSILSDLGIAA